MNGLNFSIPHRLFFIRITVTLGLIISFFLSLNLWGGQRYFPSEPVFEHFFIKAPFDFVLMGLSILFLICSLVFYNTRTFILLALLVNVFLVLFDINRLQPWFYIYNSVLFIILFYNGRVDNPEKFTSIFILLQLIFCSVYFFNGLNQLKNQSFSETDYYELILPLKSLLSERHFLFFLKTGKIVPWLFMLSGVLFLIVPARYLAVSIMLFIHAVLLVLMFPAFYNNPALWFMNLVFGICVFFLFSGNTRQRYFSPVIVFKKPAFYLVLTVFFILPITRHSDFPPALSHNFKCGRTGAEQKPISENEYRNLPFYSRAFCLRVQNGYMLDMKKWCSHELNSEYLHSSVSQLETVASSDDSDEEKELSLLPD